MQKARGYIIVAVLCESLFGSSNREVVEYVLSQAKSVSYYGT